jgi:predicted metal-binding membrane protein
MLPVGSDPVAALVRRDRALMWTGIGALVAAAWAYLFYLRERMGAPADGAMSGMAGMTGELAPWTVVDLAFTVMMWAIMMVGMMLPAAAPVILLFATVNRKRREQGASAVPTAAFGLGYLLVWGGFSILAGLAQWGLHAAALLSPTMAAQSPLVGGALLVAAGVYQITPLKEACLAHCRTPLGFFMTEWRDGLAGALQMGLRHGVYCLGCCWVLMGLLFVTGVMNLAWVAVIAFFVLLEKTAPGGRLIGRLASVGLIAAGIAVLGRASGHGGM